jgi:ribosomal protein S6
MSQDTHTRLYELGYIITPTTTESDVAGVVSSLKQAIEALSGQVTTESTPEFIDLAYTMEKNIGSKKMKWSQGYFGWIKFETDPASLEGLKKVLDGNTDIVRYILIKTSVENTVVFKKPKVDAKRETALSEEDMEALISASEAEAAEELKEEHEKLPDLEADSASESTASTEA